MDIAALGYRIDSSQAVAAEKNLDRMNAAAGRAAGGADVVSIASGRAAGGLGKFANQGRMVALQLNQVTQQGLATGQWAQAFAIQAGDIALAFGTVGAAIGIVLPLVINLGANFISATGSVNTFKDAMSALREEIATAEDELALLRSGLASMEQLKVQREINDLQAERRQIMSDLEDMSNRQARNARGRLRVLDELIASAQAELDKSILLNDQIALAEQGVFGIRDALEQLNWQAQIDGARGLADVLAEAAGNAWAMAQARASIESGQFELGLGAAAYGGAQSSMRDATSEFLANGTVLPEETGGGRSTRGGGASRLEQQRERELEAFVASLMTERETLEAWRVEQLDLLAQYNDRELEAIGGAEEAKTRIMEEYARRRGDIVDGERDRTLGIYSGLMGNMAALAQAGGEKTFKVWKAFSIAQATIDSYRAYTQVLADPFFIGRPFMRAVAAGSILASGLAQVASIAGTSMGGGGSKGGSSGAPVGASSGAAAADPERVVRLTVQGDKWMRDLVEGLVTQIYEASEDGARVIVAR